MYKLDPYQPKVFTDENGVKNIIEYKENDAGKKVKVNQPLRYFFFSLTLGGCVY
jgi:hypothetical protein